MTDSPEQSQHGEPDEQVIDATVVPDPLDPAASPGPPVIPAPDYTESGVPTFESVRDKIEKQAGTAAGATELDADSEAGRTLAEQWEDRQEAARRKLEEIRKSMGR
ncbi:PspA domain-containing protein [Rhodococcus sp. NPDC127528]|uniref:PspA domain-containing protein n=1 Tax=unclassified Rhodococcus (in: high G+C Gram-positive bacteria) TaxID=192944 RepID=UPI00363AA690